MNAQALMLPLLLVFVNCFTGPGFQHFQEFLLAHMALLGFQHCVTEAMRATGMHHRQHWTTPYKFLVRARWSCREVSQKLLELIADQLHLGSELILALDDTLAKKIGKKFFGLGYYPDPTDKNPGAHKRKVRGHCWVVMALLIEKAGRWFAFPFSALLFVPQAACPQGWPFRTKIELAAIMIQRLRWPAKKLTLVVDNLYAKAQLAGIEWGQKKITMISRLRSNAAMFEFPQRKPGRGRPPKRGKKVNARQLWMRRSKRKKLTVKIYGKTVTLEAFVGVVIPSPTLGDQPILVIIFPQRGGKKMNVFFTTQLDLAPERTLEIYAARFKIEDAFDELKTTGGFADCRQRSFTALKRHATLCLVAYSLLRLLSLTLPGAHRLEAEPWWAPAGPPSVTRLRRVFFKALRIFPGLHSQLQTPKNSRLPMAA